MRKLTKAERLAWDALPEKNARRQARQPKTNGEGVLLLDPSCDYAPGDYKDGLIVETFTGHSAREAQPQSRWLMFSDIALASVEERKPNGRPTRTEFERLRRQLNSRQVEFLVLDLGIALTMAHIAAGAESGSDRRERNIRNARRAYDTVLRLQEKVYAPSAERHLLGRKLIQLHLALADLGEHFQSLPFAE